MHKTAILLFVLAIYCVSVVYGKNIMIYNTHPEHNVVYKHFNDVLGEENEIFFYQGDPKYTDLTFNKGCADLGIFDLIIYNAGNEEEDRGDLSGLLEYANSGGYVLVTGTGFNPVNQKKTSYEFLGGSNFEYKFTVSSDYSDIAIESSPLTTGAYDLTGLDYVDYFYSDTDNLGEMSLVGINDGDAAIPVITYTNYYYSYVFDCLSDSCAFWSYRPTGSGGIFYITTKEPDARAYTSEVLKRALLNLVFNAPSGNLGYEVKTVLVHDQDLADETTALYKQCFFLGHKVEVVPALVSEQFIFLGCDLYSYDVVVSIGAFCSVFDNTYRRSLRDNLLDYLDNGGYFIYTGHEALDDDITEFLDFGFFEQLNLIETDRIMNVENVDNPMTNGEFDLRGNDISIIHQDFVQEGVLIFPNFQFDDDDTNGSLRTEVVLPYSLDDDYDPGQVGLWTYTEYDNLGAAFWFSYNSVHDCFFTENNDIGPERSYITSFGENSQPLNGELQGTEFNVNVADQGLVNYIEVSVNITHTDYDGDLKLELTSPSGKTIILRNNEPSDDTIIITYSDINFGEGFTTPVMPFNLFRGEEASGTWTLTITDEYDYGDPSLLGELNSWELVIGFQSEEDITLANYRNNPAYQAIRNVVFNSNMNWVNEDPKDILVIIDDDFEVVFRDTFAPEDPPEDDGEDDGITPPEDDGETPPIDDGETPPIEVLKRNNFPYINDDDNYYYTYFYEDDYTDFNIHRSCDCDPEIVVSESEPTFNTIIFPERGFVLDIEVSVELDFFDDDSLTISLISPNGIEVLLKSGGRCIPDGDGDGDGYGDGDVATREVNSIVKRDVNTIYSSSRTGGEFTSPFDSFLDFKLEQITGAWTLVIDSPCDDDDYYDEFDDDDLTNKDGLLHNWSISILTIADCGTQLAYKIYDNDIDAYFDDDYEYGTGDDDEESRSVVVDSDRSFAGYDNVESVATHIEVHVEYQEQTYYQLEMTLIAPNGDEYLLISTYDYTIGDTYSVTFSNYRVGEDIVQPIDDLSDLRGTDPTGTWTLEISGDNSYNSVVYSWYLIVYYESYGSHSGYSTFGSEIKEACAFPGNNIEYVRGFNNLFLNGDLTNYDAIIWVNDDSAPTTFDNVEENLTNYVTDGGYLLLTGRDSINNLSIEDFYGFIELLPLVDTEEDDFSGDFFFCNGNYNYYTDDDYYYYDDDFDDDSDDDFGYYNDCPIGTILDIESPLTTGLWDLREVNPEFSDFSHFLYNYEIRGVVPDDDSDSSTILFETACDGIYQYYDDDENVGDDDDEQCGIWSHYPMGIEGGNVMYMSVDSVTDRFVLYPESSALENMLFNSQDERLPWDSFKLVSWDTTMNVLLVGYRTSVPKSFDLLLSNPNINVTKIEKVGGKFLLEEIEYDQYDLVIIHALNVPLFLDPVIPDDTKNFFKYVNDGGFVLLTGDDSITDGFQLFFEYPFVGEALYFTDSVVGDNNFENIQTNRNPMTTGFFDIRGTSGDIFDDFNIFPSANSFVYSPYYYNTNYGSFDDTFLNDRVLYEDDEAVFLHHQIGDGFVFYLPDWDDQIVQERFSTGPILLEVNAQVSPTISTIDVNSSQNVNGLEVTLNMPHTFIGDLIIDLESPSGSVVTLFDQQCSGSNDLIGTFSDFFVGTGDPCDGFDSWEPLESLSVFDGEPFDGVWTLTIVDVCCSDDGDLLEWDLFNRGGNTDTFTENSNLIELQKQTFMNILYNAALPRAKPYQQNEIFVPEMSATCMFLTEPKLFLTYDSPIFERVEIRSDNPMVVADPLTLTLDSEDGISDVPFTINCRRPGEVYQMTFIRTSDDSVIATREGICKGEFFIVGASDGTSPTSTVRGNDVELIIGINPPPLEETEISIFSSNYNILAPGSPTITFGVGQTESRVNLISQIGEVGPVTLEFKSNRLRDYGPSGCTTLSDSLFYDFIVMGTMRVNNLPENNSIGDGVSFYGELEIIPQANQDNIQVHFDASEIGIGDPDTLVFNQGQNTQTFRLYPNTNSNGAIHFTSDFYQTLNVPLTIIGSIFTDTDSQSITSLVPTTVTINILPTAPSAGLNITIDSSDNVDTVPWVFLPSGSSVTSILITPTSVGSAWLSFSAPGYSTEIDNFVISAASGCDSDSIISSNGIDCLPCPTNLAGDICSNNGVCTQSIYSTLLTSCQCNLGFQGTTCEFRTQDSSSFDLFPITNSNQHSNTLFSPSTLLGTSNVVLIIPPFIIPTNYYNNNDFSANIFIQPYDSSLVGVDFIDPSANPPVVDNKSPVPHITGFNIDLSVNDNTIVSFQANSPMTFTFQFSPQSTTNDDFNRIALYYYNHNSNSWMNAELTCSNPIDQVVSKDPSSLLYTSNICAFGQYQFFLLQNIANPPLTDTPDAYDYLTQPPVPPESINTPPGTTGVTGYLPPQPPQPNFTPPGGVLSPIQKDPFESSDSSKLQMTLSFLFIILSFCFLL